MTEIRLPRKIHSESLLNSGNWKIKVNYCFRRSIIVLIIVLVSQTEFFEEKVAEKLTGNLKLSESDSDASGTALVNVEANETDEDVLKTETK